VELERARLGYLEAVLDRSRDEEYQALRTLARLTPADPEVFRGLAQIDLSAHRYSGAVESYQQALARAPESVWLWNELGYARSYARDLPGAVEALRRYQQLRPQEANPLDSLGDVHFYLGRFPEAERYYLEGYGKQPGFLGGGELFKAAWARLMSGDRQTADGVFQKYLEFRRSAGDPLVEYRQAEWEFLTGRRQAAMARLERLAEGPARSLAYSQLSIWSLVSGDRERACQYATRALRAATQPASRLLPALCSFLCQPPASAAEWQARAERALPEAAPPAAQQYVLACALLLGKHAAAAVRLLRQLYDQTPPSSSDPVNVLLAWALIDSQRFAELGELLNTYPVRRPDSEQPLLALSFPRVFFLRGVYLEKLGRQGEAQASYKLYEELIH
jgi:tetratricopeptide (TPR) repeat protein